MREKTLTIEVVVNCGKFGLCINDKLISGPGISGFWVPVHKFQVKESDIRDLLTKEKP